MLRPNFEDPIDTADQIIEKNLKPHTIWGASLIIYLFSIHQDPALQKLSKLLYIPENDVEYFNMSKRIDLKRGLIFQWAILLLTLDGSQERNGT